MPELTPLYPQPNPYNNQKQSHKKMLQNTSTLSTLSSLPSLAPSFSTLTHYPSTKNEFTSQNRYILGLTRQQVSEYITGFPFIFHIYKKNTPNNQWRLLDQLMRAPSETDGPGFIYGFMNERENSLLEAPYWIKIGRTKQNPPQRRIFQWERDDDMEVTEIFTVRTLYQKKLQALVHILFAYARQDRQINGKQRVQWFHFQQITLTAAAVNILNHIMNSIHTSPPSQPKTYLNRSLKQLTDKITQSNAQLADILSVRPRDVVESFVRDLGIELGREDGVKGRLRDCGDLGEVLGVVQGFGVGGQIRGFLERVRDMEQLVSKYLEAVTEYRIQTLEQVKQIYDKTKINLAYYQTQAQGLASEKSQKKAPKEPKSKSIKPLKQKEQKEKQPKQKRTPAKSKTKKQPQPQPQISKEPELRVKEEQAKIEIVILEKQLHKEESTNVSEVRMVEHSRVEETVSVRVYNSDGKQERVEEMAVKQVHKTGTTLKKYRAKPKDVSILNPPSPHEQSIIISSKFQQAQDSHPTALAQNCTQIPFKAQKMSQILTLRPNQPLTNHKYIIKAEHFTLDSTELKLDSGYLIMARHLTIDEAFKIRRTRPEKGFLKVFCLKVQGADRLNVEKNCEKYVSFFVVSDSFNFQVIAVDAYHRGKEADQAVRDMGRRLLALFPSP